MPARALLGDAWAIAALLALDLAAALATGWALQLWFAAGAQAVVAGTAGQDAALRADGRTFRAGAGTALVGKELRLLRRYPGLAGWPPTT